MLDELRCVSFYIETEMRSGAALTEFSLETDFSHDAPETAVEQKFVYPLLVHTGGLGILRSLVKPQQSIEAISIDKGSKKKRYAPDHLVYSQGYPVLVVENKRPSEHAATAVREAQLYAAQLNAKYPTGINPVNWVLGCNGVEIILQNWDSEDIIFRDDISNLHLGSSSVSRLRDIIGSDQLQSFALGLNSKLIPNDWHFPYEVLGQNRVHLAKVGHNEVFELINPILRAYFDPKNDEYEKLIIKEAYVNTKEHTRYERSFENFIRERIVPTTDPTGTEIETTKKSSDVFERRFREALGKNSPFMQLIIGGVGSGKSSFIKRFFDVILPADLQQKIIYCYINFNHASDDLHDLNTWISQQFIKTVREKYSKIVNIEDDNTLLSIFSPQIRDNKGAYSFLKRAGEEKYWERIGTDLLGWMRDPPLFARELARHLAGDKGYTLVIALDNVDRRTREAQLKIFQTGQWFMRETRSVCLMTIRDETYEVYKGEKPLDAFSKLSNFYIRPPRFVDMIQKRLDLALRNYKFGNSERVQIDLTGLAKISVPREMIGVFLSSVYADLFRGRRQITIVLEGPARRNAREALEMFSAILTSAHFPANQFSLTGLTSGVSQIKEASLIKSLMRTNYLYFSPDHGFIKNIFSLRAPASNQIISLNLRSLIGSSKIGSGPVMSV